jgi:hypothetical protein
MADVTHRPFRHLCPEADELDALSDGEFWDRVAESFGVGGGPDTEPDFDDMEPTDEELHRPPCEVCGSIGACGYDTEGLPLIHAIAPDDES